MPTPEYISQLRTRIGHDLLMMPVANALVLNDAGEVLLQQRSDNGRWALPGGIMEPGEEPAETLIREVYEETGLRVAPERLVGVYGGDGNVGAFPNGDRYAMIVMTFKCRVTGGELRIDGDETLALAYFAPDALPDTLLERHRLRIEHAFALTTPYFAMPQP